MIRFCRMKSGIIFTKEYYLLWLGHLKRFLVKGLYICNLGEQFRKTQRHELKAGLLKIILGMGWRWPIREVLPILILFIFI